MTNRLRYPLLAVSLLILFAAIWAGMVRLGWRWPVLLPALSISHCPLMVSDFLSTQQVSFFGRIVADLTGSWQLRLWTGLLNGIALTLFIGTMMIMVVRGLKVEGRSSA